MFRHETKDGKEIVIYDFICACGAKGGELTFPVEHGRESDEALLAEIKKESSHICDTCCCKGRDVPSHVNYGKACIAKKHF